MVSLNGKPIKMDDHDYCCHWMKAKPKYTRSCAEIRLAIKGKTPEGLENL